MKKMNLKIKKNVLNVYVDGFSRWLAQLAITLNKKSINIWLMNFIKFL